MPDMETDIFACLQCGYCKNVCPVYNQIGWESVTPRGKMYFLKQYLQRSPTDSVLRRKVDLKPLFAQRVYECTSCGACEEECHVEIKFTKRWEEVREWLVEEGLGPMFAHKGIYEKVRKFRNPYGEAEEKRGDWLPKEVNLSDKPEVIFFSGCTEAYRMQPLAQASVKLLSAAGVKFSILGRGEWCCGSPLIRTGQTDIVKQELVPHNVNEIERRGIETVVTACAGCYNTIRGDYPKVVGELPFHLYHISQYLEILIKEGKLKFSKPLAKTITYHDPCHLGRHAKVYEPARDVLNVIPGVKLVEMDKIKNKARCCGAGGGFKSAFNELAENIAASRVAEAKETNAELIVTACPFCVLNLNAGTKKANIDLKTTDIVQLALQAV